jgi:Rrf2 family transcriptional regulator, nitric oxide-sensitive transcriptional repressor
MIFHLSEAANLAIHALNHLASNSDLQPISTIQVAEALGASNNHLSKVFQRLTKVGLVTSIRGPRGGFCLAWDPKDVTLLEIYEAIDGPLGKDSCLLGHEECDRETCVFGGLVTNIQSQVDKYFSNTTLADLIEK